MMRLATAIVGVGLVLASATFVAPAVSPAATNNASNLFPLDGPNQLETYARLDCHGATGSCDFTVGADMKTPDGVTGFPHDLWSGKAPKCAPPTGWPTWTCTPLPNTTGS